MNGISWGSVELEPEIETWLEKLNDHDFGQAAFYFDLLAARGPGLDEPYSRQLNGKLRELRFYLNRQRVRVTYYITTGRRIILLTVFRKTKQVERKEVERAIKAMDKCITQGHTAED